MDIENKKCYNNERGEARISFEQLTLADDFMFFKVMQDENLCRQLLEVILNKPIEKIVYVKNQESAQTTYDAKCIRMDVYVKDKNHTIYNIEMQNRNTKELPQRTRYYHSTVDQTQLKRGQDYSKLPDSYVIFICTFDLFGVGFGKYTFEPVCIEDKNIHLCDGSHTIFVNAKGVADDQKLQEFIDYLRTGKVSESLFIKQLDDAVKVASHNAKWREEYEMLIMQEQYLLNQGREEGREEERENHFKSIMKLINSGVLSLEDYLEKADDNEEFKKWYLSQK